MTSASNMNSASAMYLHTQRNPPTGPNLKGRGITYSARVTPISTIRPVVSGFQRWVTDGG